MTLWWSKTEPRPPRKAYYPWGPFDDAVVKRIEDALMNDLFLYENRKVLSEYDITVKFDKWGATLHVKRPPYLVVPEIVPVDGPPADVVE